MKKSLLQKQNVGNAGEYYLAARLSALDFTATITLGRAEKYDILALGPKSKLVKISVKTTQRSDAKSFPLSVKDETGFSDDFYYAFIRLNDFKVEPDVWIIPSQVVCKHLKERHAHWLQTPGRKGKLHVDTPMRQFNLVSTDFEKAMYPTWESDLNKYHMNFEQII